MRSDQKTYLTKSKDTDIKSDILNFRLFGV